MSQYFPNDQYNIIQLCVDNIHSEFKTDQHSLTEQERVIDLVSNFTVWPLSKKQPLVDFGVVPRVTHKHTNGY